MRQHPVKVATSAKGAAEGWEWRYWYFQEAIPAESPAKSLDFAAVTPALC